MVAAPVISEISVTGITVSSVKIAFAVAKMAQLSAVGCKAPKFLLTIFDKEYQITSKLLNPLYSLAETS